MFETGRNFLQPDCGLTGEVAEPALPLPGGAPLPGQELPARQVSRHPGQALRHPLSQQAAQVPQDQRPVPYGRGPGRVQPERDDPREDLSAGADGQHQGRPRAHHDRAGGRGAGRGVLQGAGRP